MKKPIAKMVALLRGINVGGNKKVPMQVLRELASAAGLIDVATYIQSGNLVFGTTGTAAAAEVLLEKIIAKQFGFPVEVIVRTAAQWKGYAQGSPFATAQLERPNLVLLGLSKKAPLPDAAAKLRERAAHGELIEIKGDAVWIDFHGGVGVSKLTPAVLDRAVGSTVTARNFRTVQELQQRLSGIA